MPNPLNWCRLRTLLSAIVCSVSLGACSFPTQGPSADEILAPNESASHYELVEVDSKTSAHMSEAETHGFSAPFINAPVLSTSTRLGVGDVISVTIFEAGQGGLFSNDKGPVTIPQIVIDQVGTIAIPYASEIQALGKTPKEVERQIVTALSGKALEPQAIVSVMENANNSVTVQGAIARPSHVPLSLAGSRLTDVLVATGGPRVPSHETIISVTRGRTTSTASAQRILDDPRQNIALRSGDIITVAHKPRSFTVTGSVNRPAHITFEKERMSVMEAVGKASGLLDQRADPSSVFVFRRESSHTLKSLGISSSGWWSIHRSGIPTVYWFDLSKPETLFHAQSAPIHDGDLIYVANAETVELSKVLTLFGLTFRTANQVVTVTE